MKACFCSGSVVHHRLSPIPHRFKYHMSWCLFDLDSLDELFAQSKFWSINKFNIVTLKNRDYINTSEDSIKQKAMALIQKRTQNEFKGKIFLFTHPRYLGFGFNSVNFYFCYEKNNLIYIISEINNTPWKQKHLYFHNIQDSHLNTNMHKADYVFEFQKDFHISPFVDMNIDYIWKFNVNLEKLSVAMKLKHETKTLMHVNLQTKLQPILKTNQISWTIRQPFQALKMFIGIYWQALKLWYKRVPFFSHPDIEAIPKEIKK